MCYGVCKKIKYGFLISACLLFMIAMTVYAGTGDEKKVIKIGYIDYGRFVEKNEDGTYSGYGVELLQEISNYTGWEYEYVYGTWDDILEALEEGEIDFICQAQKTAEREQSFLFSKYSAGTETCVLYVRDDDERYYYNEFQAFDGLRIAGLRSSFQNHDLKEYAQTKQFSYTLQEYGTQQECFDALESKTADAVVLGSLSGKTDYKMICRFGAQPFYFMTGKQNKELMDAVDEALGVITADNPSILTDLYDKYYAETTASGIAFTREEIEALRSGNELTVAFFANREPFSGQDKDGVIGGITVDIMELIAQKSGLKFRYVMLEPGERAAEYLEKHPDVFVAGIMVENEELRSEDYIMSDMFYKGEIALACMRGTGYQIGDKYRHYVLAIPGSYAALESYMKKNYPQFSVIRCDTTAECMEFVKKGKADFMAQNINVLTPLLQNPHYEGMTVLPTMFMQENMGIVCMAGWENEQWMNIMNKCICQISEQELSQITINHTVSGSYKLTWQDMLYKFRFPLIVILALLLLSIAFMISWQNTRRRGYLEIEKKNVQLLEAVTQANRANHAKSEFLAHMSHEIRTPMNVISGLAEIARHYESQPEKVAECLEKINISSKVLLNMMNDILDMSAIECNKIKIAHEPFCLSEIMESVYHIYAPQCRQKNINFAIDCGMVKHGYLIGDGLRVNQIFMNLVSNAYKFTGSGGEIRVTARELPVRGEKAYFNITVSDTGEGMTEDLQKRLFRPFEQESAATVQKYGGSGLGLSITKNFVEMMSGSISVKSKKGEGTVFMLSLPFDIDSRQQDDRKMDPDIEKKQYDFGGKTILLAEDTQMNAEIVTELLALANMNVEVAEDGEKAVQLFEQSKPGTYYAVFLDVHMPKMNGYQAAEAIRKLRRKDAGTIKIYALTASAFTEDISAALNSGMDGHIAKPIDARVLYSVLDDIGASEPETGI